MARPDRAAFTKGMILHGGPHPAEPGRLLTRELTPPPSELPAADLKAIEERLRAAQKHLEEYPEYARKMKLPR
jgi:hypothetical protein